MNVHRGSCYMKCNPAKCGIKFYYLCDAKTVSLLLETCIAAHLKTPTGNWGFRKKTELDLNSFYNDTVYSVFSLTDILPGISYASNY